jgi:hypothetical protein
MYQLAERNQFTEMLDVENLNTDDDDVSEGAA